MKTVDAVRPKTGQEKTYGAISVVDRNTVHKYLSVFVAVFKTHDFAKIKISYVVEGDDWAKKIKFAIEPTGYKDEMVGKAIVVELERSRSSEGILIAMKMDSASPFDYDISGPIYIRIDGSAFGALVDSKTRLVDILYDALDEAVGTFVLELQKPHSIGEHASFIKDLSVVASLRHLAEAARRQELTPILRLS